ncbi:MAG: MotA/TolQ/ExbB proton channel family protein [Nitrospirota bacterium]|nr:MotA/TolQ/ExbB proton channel family protein [Nitrospirota bacterium]
MIQILISGGWMMIPIVLCSIVAVTVIIERVWFFRRNRFHQEADQMLALIQQGKFSEALSLGGRNSTLLLRVLAAGVLARNSEPEKAMESAGIAEVSAMKRGLMTLDTIITLAPLLGLLGTIIGMIDSFGIMAESGIGQPHAVTGGVAKALICTAAGIIVAVVSLVPYNYFLSRIERYTELIEEYATRAESVFHKATEKS